MIPIEFPQRNTMWKGSLDSGVRDLPAYTDDQATVSCWKMTWPERLRVLLTGRVWLLQLNFSNALQPQKVTVRSPFVE